MSTRDSVARIYRRTERVAKQESRVMRTSERRSYTQIDHWRKYQQFLPDRMRLSARPRARRGVVALAWRRYPSGPVRRAGGPPHGNIAPRGRRERPASRPARLDAPGARLRGRHPRPARIRLECRLAGSGHARPLGRLRCGSGRSGGPADRQARGPLRHEPGRDARLHGRRPGPPGGGRDRYHLARPPPPYRERAGRQDPEASPGAHPAAAAVCRRIRRPAPADPVVHEDGENRERPEVARLVCEDSVGGGSKVPLRFLARSWRSGRRSSRRASTSARCSSPTPRPTAGRRSRPVSPSSTGSGGPRSW